MDLVRHLRYFLVVAEELNFRRAAQRLYMAQPPLSQRIRRLEQEYGAQLFDRSGGRVRLTPAGETLQVEAVEIVSRVDRSRMSVRRAIEGMSDSVRAAVPPDTPSHVLAALSTEFAAAFPDVRLGLQEATTSNQVAQLQAGELDVGVLQLPIDANGLRLGPVVTVVPGIAVHRASPLAAGTDVELRHLAGEHLVVFPRAAAPGMYDETLDTCRRHGFEPLEVHHAHNAEFRLGMVAARHGVAIDQGSAAQKEPRVKWLPLVGDPIVWRISVAWPADSAHSNADRFAEIATEVYRNIATIDPLPALPPVDDGTVPKPWSVVFPAGFGRRS